MAKNGQTPVSGWGPFEGARNRKRKFRMSNKEFRSAVRNSLFDILQFK